MSRPTIPRLKNDKQIDCLQKRNKVYISFNKPYDKNNKKIGYDYFKYGFSVQGI